jgi:hypothetical protein
MLVSNRSSRRTMPLPSAARRVPSVRTPSRFVGGHCVRGFPPLFCLAHKRCIRRARPVGRFRGRGNRRACGHGGDPSRAPRPAARASLISPAPVPGSAARSIAHDLRVRVDQHRVECKPLRWRLPSRISRRRRTPAPGADAYGPAVCPPSPDPRPSRPPAAAIADPLENPPPDGPTRLVIDRHIGRNLVQHLGQCAAQRPG